VTPKLILDSGTSEHYIYNKDWLLNYKTVFNKNIKIANGEVFPMIGQRDIPVKINSNNSYTEAIIKDVFYIPKLNTNLISSKKLTNKD
jgi:hypothetical protein